MTKKHQPTAIRELVESAVGRIADKKKRFYEEDIRKAWERAVGKEASRHSHPAGIRGNALVINVDSPIWIYQLNLKKSRIESRINKLIKPEKHLNIRLRAGETQ